MTYILGLFVRYDTIGYDIILTCAHVSVVRRSLVCLSVSLSQLFSYRNQFARSIDLTVHSSGGVSRNCAQTYRPTRTTVAGCSLLSQTRLRFSKYHQEQTREDVNASVFVTVVGHGCLQ